MNDWTQGDQMQSITVYWMYGGERQWQSHKVPLWLARRLGTGWDCYPPYVVLCVVEIPEYMKRHWF